jgi:hypothetical protein
MPPCVGNGIAPFCAAICPTLKNARGSFDEMAYYSVHLDAAKKLQVRFKPPELAPQTFVAERAEFQGEHIVLLRSGGQLAALMLVAIVESWSEVQTRR